MRRHPRFQPTLSRLEGRWMPSAGPYPDAFRQGVHEQYVAQAGQAGNPVVLLGDSITFNWGNATAGAPGSSTFRADLAPLGSANFGIVGDTTQNLLYRVQDGELAGHPKVAVVMVGINDLLGGASPEQAASGVASVVDAIRAQSPTTKVLVLSILPTAMIPLNAEVAQADALISALGTQPGVTYLNLYNHFVAPDGAARPTLLGDLVHPDAAGYQVLGRAIEPTLLGLLGDPSLPGSDSIDSPAPPASTPADSPGSPAPTPPGAPVSGAVDGSATTPPLEVIPAYFLIPIDPGAAATPILPNAPTAQHRPSPVVVVEGPTG